ncbi:hypothetical protein TNCV_2752111 [Trichonephila clavipes]|nr:hypothetical protein TNCV_2752111 [Trichonephila clavipes]
MFSEFPQAMQNTIKCNSFDGSVSIFTSELLFLGYVTNQESPEVKLHRSTEITIQPQNLIKPESSLTFISTETRSQDTPFTSLGS